MIATLILLVVTAAPDAYKASWDLLVQGMAAGKPEKRIDALTALATLKTKRDAVKLIEAALADKDAAVRAAAAEALGEMESQRSIPKLKQAMDDPSPEVSFTAARVLWDLGDRSGREMLQGILAGERRGQTGVIRGQVGDAKKKLRNPLGMGLEQIRNRGTALLGPFGLGVGVVEEMMKDGSATSRATAAALLAADKESAAQLEAALADKNWVVRVAAAKALGDLSRHAEVPKLQPLLGDGKDAVRYMAAASILRCRPRPPKQP